MDNYSDLWITFRVGNILLGGLVAVVPVSMVKLIAKAHVMAVTPMHDVTKKVGGCIFGEVAAGFDGK